MGIFGGTPKPTTYLFVDAGHLRTSFRRVIDAWCTGSRRLDVRKVSSHFSANKTFYYDSLDDSLHERETPEAQRERIGAQEAVFRAINALPNTHVRLGSVTGTRKKLRQKEVDILIAVDMMTHAVRGNMAKAVLLTGDRDFTPLVEALVQLGLTIDVAGDRRSTSDILAAAADSYRALTLRIYHSWMSDREQRECQLPLLEGGDVNTRDLEPVATGHVGEYQGALYPTGGPTVLFIMRNEYGAIHANVPRDGLQRFKLYLELEHGDVAWLPTAM
jgi:uncharacterized LabA/DUF88 family protein